MAMGFLVVKVDVVLGVACASLYFTVKSPKKLFDVIDLKKLLI